MIRFEGLDHVHLNMESWNHDWDWTVKQKIIYIFVEQPKLDEVVNLAFHKYL